MKKDKIITIRVSQEEFLNFEKLAQELGLSLSSYIRMCMIIKSKEK